MYRRLSDGNVLSDNITDTCGDEIGYTKSPGNSLSSGFYLNVVFHEKGPTRATHIHFPIFFLHSNVESKHSQL